MSENNSNNNNENNNNIEKRIKDTAKKATKKAVKIGAFKITAFISPVLVPLIIIVFIFLIGSAIISNVSELFEAKNTPEKIYKMLDIDTDEDLSKLVEVKEDGNGGYYLGFVDGFDKKIDKVVKELNDMPGVHDVTNDREFIIKLIEAELVTQFPNLGGTVPEDSDGFQGATTLIRLSPNKEIGEMKNAGVGETTVVEEEEEDDLHASKSEEKKVEEWEKGDILTPTRTTYAYEQTKSKIKPGRDTKHWDKIWDNKSSTYKKVYKDEELTYTGKYKEGINPSTNEVTLYAEVEKVKEKKEDEKEDEKEKFFIRVEALEKKNNKEANINIKDNKTKSIAGKIVNATDNETDSNDKKIAGKEARTYTVAIAAGHNNTNNTGAHNDSLGLKEEDITVQVAEEVEELLSIYTNIKVVQTGSTSSNRGGINKGDRTGLARAAQPDLCLQIHIDAGGGSGVSTYYKVGDNMSQQLGEIMADNMAKSMGINNRGCMDETHTAVGTLGIIESSATSGFPSIVTEGGFIDGSPDQEMYKSGVGVDKYSKGIVDGILDYLQVDHQGYGATTSKDEKYTDDIESKAIALSYVSNEDFSEYINNEDEEALNVFTLRSGKVITATWSYNDETGLDIKENTEIDLQTALQKYMVPYEYLLYFYINSGEKDFSMDLADEILKTKIIMNVKDNVTTTATTTIQEERRTSDIASQSYDWTEVSRDGPIITESVKTTTSLLYADAWCVKVYQKDNYTSELIEMSPGDDGIIVAKGRVTESSGASTSGESSRPFSWFGTSSDGSRVRYRGTLYTRTRTETSTISHEYGKEDLKADPQEGKFVKLYQKHQMVSVVYPERLFMIMGENDDEDQVIIATDDEKNAKEEKPLTHKNRTINLIDLTKYLIYLATGTSYDDIVEYDFSEFLKGTFNSFGVGGYTFTGDDSILWKNNFTREEFVAYIQTVQVPNPGGCASGSGLATNQEGWDTFYKSCAGVWYDICTEHGIDPIVIMCWSLNESGWGTSRYAQQRGNLWGWGAVDSNPDNAKSGTGNTKADKAMNLLETICISLEETVSNPKTHWRYGIAVSNGLPDPDLTTIRGTAYWYCSTPESWTQSCTKLMKSVFGDFISSHNSGASIGNIEEVCKEITQLFLSRNAYYGPGTYNNIKKVYESDNCVVCATYVSLVLYKSGLMEEDHINKYNYHFTGDFPSMLSDAGWKQVSKSDLKPGDVINKPSRTAYGGGHVVIYVGNNTIWDQNSITAKTGKGSSASYYINDPSYIAWRSPNM